MSGAAAVRAIDQQVPGTTSRVGGLLPAETRLGRVALTVGEIDRSIDFYTRVIGLSLRERGDGVATLASGEVDLVVLHEHRTGRRAERESGVFHVALLFPTRDELARVAARLAASGTPISGASDHGHHESIYLPDPDGIGLELAADRPREQWPINLLAHPPAPLDLQALLRSVAGEQPPASAASGVTISHVNLHVGDLASAKAFYLDGLGFELAAEVPTAAFATAGDYHHRVGFNLWRGEGVPPADPDAFGLRYWTLIVGSEVERDAVRDRLAALAVPVQELDDGDLLARDPANIAVVIAR